MSEAKNLLLVDDEELVREVTAMMLEDIGFTVTTASGGSEALASFEKTPSISVAVVDFSMPEMTGYELMCRLRELKPDIGLVMISGLTITPEVQKMYQAGGLEFLSKPFDNDNLVRAIELVTKWSEEKRKSS